MFKTFLKIKRIVKKRSIKKKKLNTQYIDLKERTRLKVLERLVKYRDFYLSNVNSSGHILTKVYNLNLLNYKRVAIRDQKSRWGSCSSRGNLNFNYRLILLSEEMCDYVIVHELCHLLEMNHSDRFWSLVALAVPDYQSVKVQMRKINIAKMV